MIDDILIHEEDNLFISSSDISANNEDSLLHEEAMCLWEMANLTKKTTGLDGLVVWLRCGGDRLQHGPRIKVVKGIKYNPELSSTVPLHGVPRIIGNAKLTQNEFADLIKWIHLNKKTILKYWHDSISTEEMISSIEKLT